MTAKAMAQRMSMQGMAKGGRGPIAVWYDMTTIAPTGKPTAAPTRRAVILVAM